MSNQSNNSSEYLKEVLTRFNEARVAREFGQALVWVGTAAILDSETDRADPSSPVNLALFQLVYDTALSCENLVLHCGNVTTTHGDWLSYGQEANDLLVSRLDEKSPEAERSLAVLVQGHFNNLFEQLEHHFDRETTFSYTTGQEATLLLDTCKAVRQRIAAHDSLKIVATIDWNRRAELLKTCVTSPDYEIMPFPFRFLNSWDKAVFFIEGAQSIVAEIRATPGILASGRATLLFEVEDALAASRRLTLAQSKEAKLSFRRIYKLGNELATSLSA